MAARPRGTVTFLFTDVEGSTRLLKLLRDRYGGVLEQHQRIVRDAFTARGGEEVDTQGDAFFYVFSRARDAAEAAAAAQRALAAQPWPEGAELRIRIGMHTGEPSVSDEGRYHGLGVHRAARIVAAASGGQILCSQATAAVLEDDEPAGLHLRDLGHHRLKDLDRPEHIYQLDVDGLPHAFPPLRTRMAAPRRWTRPPVLVAGAVATVAAVAAAVLGLALSGSAHALSEVDANALGFLDPASGRITAQVAVGATPTHVAVGEGAVWVTNSDAGTVSRIDPAKRSVVQTITVGSGPSGIATGGGAVWVASLDGVVSWIDPATNNVVKTIRVGNGPAGIAYGAGAIWVANTGDDTITRIDARNGVKVATLQVDGDELTFGAGSLWASQRTANRVVRIDPATGTVVQPIAVGNGPAGLAVGDGAVWVANNLDGTASRIDPATNSVSAVISVGNGASAVAVDTKGVWVSNQFAGTVARIDPRSNQVVRRVRVGNRPQGLALGGGRLLVSVRQSGAGHRGGTLTMRIGRRTDSIDTAVAYDSTSWTILRMTGDGLVAFNQASGLAGTQLVPDLAVSLPLPTDGGTTYTFRLRPGIRYSNGLPVRATDVRQTFERNFKLGTPVPYYYDGIVGAARCERTPKHCDLSRGIVTDDRTGSVTFHLTAADPEFLDKLALPFAYLVPRGMPAHLTGTRPLPAIGPYRIVTYRPARVIRLVRNPQFHEWSQAAQPDGYPDEIVFRVGGSPDEAVKAVLAGKADAFSTSQSETPPTAATLAELKTRYASQVHANPQPATIALFLNTRLAPFDRLDVRRAINYAADRGAAVRAVGGPEVAQPTCQILPPGFPGYAPYCPYDRPNFARARVLVARSGTRGMKVTFWSWSDLPGLGPYAVKLLRSLGYRASLQARSGTYFPTVGDSRTHAQIGTTEWISDYPVASGFFNPVLTCSSFLPNNPGNSNDAQFCDPAIDRQTRRALTEQATNPDAARGVWERDDRQAVDEAPWVPLVNPRAIDVLARRVGNYQYSPAGLGMLIDQLWVR
jgi:peptide/nickel transport system substrate-binding protein